MIFDLNPSLNLIGCKPSAKYIMLHFTAGTPFAHFSPCLIWICIALGYVRFSIACLDHKICFFLFSLLFANCYSIGFNSLTCFLDWWKSVKSDKEEKKDPIKLDLACCFVNNILSDWFILDFMCLLCLIIFFCLSPTTLMNSKLQKCSIDTLHNISNKV